MALQVRYGVAAIMMVLGNLLVMVVRQRVLQVLTRLLSVVHALPSQVYTVIRKALSSVS